MHLRDLVTEESVFDARFAAREIAGVTADSRSVKRGDLFVAVPGTKADGLAFRAAGARGRGCRHRGRARPGIASAGYSLCEGRRCAARACARCRPLLRATAGDDRRRHRHERQDLGCRLHASDLGPRSATLPRASAPSASCRPRVRSMARSRRPIRWRCIARSMSLAGEGVTHLALEASSHGLDQHRLDGLRVAAGGFTNITRDHLDYHPSVEAYLRGQAPSVRCTHRAGRRRRHRCRSRARGRRRRRGAGARVAVAHGRAQGRRHPPGRDGDRWVRAVTAARACRQELCGCGCRWSARFRSRTRSSPLGLRSQPGAIPPPRSRRSSISSGAKGRLELIGDARRRAGVRRLCAQARRAAVRRWRRCGPMRAADSSSCSAPAATAIPASGR